MIHFASRIAAALALFGCVLPGTAQPAHAWESSPTASPAQKQSVPSVRAFPQVTLAGGLQLKYVGEVDADGRFRSAPKFHKFFTPLDSNGHVPPPPPALTPAGASRQEAELTAARESVKNQVPPNIDVHRNAAQVEDFQPPEHAVQIANGHSAVGQLLDTVVTAAYGARRLLVSPVAVTTDSRRRIIIADSGAHAVHVLARNSKHSFQIVGGAGRRLQSPSSVAVDDDGNIYVSDPERGVILVYDSSGEYLRMIGSYGEEGLFLYPSCVAIDRKAGRLYVADPPLHTLFIFNLQGYLLKRIETRDTRSNKNEAGFSRRTGSNAPGGFQFPQSVLIHNDKLIVLDATRVHILTLQGEPIKEFKIANNADWRKGPVPGLFMDSEDHIYISNPATDTIREYDTNGQLLGAFGQPGTAAGEFSALSGVWADSHGRVYIVDAHRIQVFQMSHK